MLDFISKGGPILWVIMGLSLVALAIVIERLLYLKRISIDEEKLFSVSYTHLTLPTIYSV